MIDDSSWVAEFPAVRARPPGRMRRVATHQSLRDSGQGIVRASVKPSVRPSGHVPVLHHSPTKSRCVRNFMSVRALAGAHECTADGSEYCEARENGRLMRAQFLELRTLSEKVRRTGKRTRPSSTDAGTVSGLITPLLMGPMTVRRVAFVLC